VAVENLEGYAPDFVVPDVTRTLAGRCVDIGHLWLDGIDPLPHLDEALPRLCVLHVHGVRATADGSPSTDPQAGRPARGIDHSSLAYADPQELERVLRRILAVEYGGVLCLEVFGEDDFRSSLATLHAAVRRVCGERGGGE
jgi:sugar phosphate isomerase/epimerase